MQWISTHLLFLFLKLLSFLPFSILFILSDIIYFILNRLYAYRKTTIDINLMNAFPHKRSQELWYIRSKYYHYLSDLLVETIKSFSISQQELKHRIQIHHESYELLRTQEKKGKHIFIVLGHYGNWEWTSLLAGLKTNLPFYALYAPSKNKTFDALLQKNRARFGAQLIATNQIKTLYTHLQKQPSMVAFLADQTPVDTENAYWTKFMSLNTPFHKGFNTLAIRTDAIVLYASIQKINRGYYEVHLKPITKQASQTTENEIAEKYVRLLETDIQHRPEYWLWSHRRWKRAGINY